MNERQKHYRRHAMKRLNERGDEGIIDFMNELKSIAKSTSINKDDLISERNRVSYIASLVIEHLEKKEKEQCAKKENKE